jgi:hypothetical protein
VVFVPGSLYFTLAHQKITHDHVYCVVMWNNWLISGPTWSKLWVRSGMLAEITGVNSNGGKSVVSVVCYKVEVSGLG